MSNTQEEPLLNRTIQLEKFPGKGGWTFARIPEIPQDKNNSFGWRKVKGFIEGVEIRQYHLMPLGNGQLFLPVKAAIRKKIKKEEGDWIKVVLYPDPGPLQVPEEFTICLKDDPLAWQHFQQFSEQEKKKYTDWIYGVKTEDLKIERMAQAVNKIAMGEKL